jgi:hypothetical protein
MRVGDSSMGGNGFRCVRVIALSVRNLDHANKFSGEMLALLPAYEDSKPVGNLVGQIILMLKAD